MISIDKLITNEAKLDLLRQKRKPLLDAFDIYKSNVSYGVIEETESQHAMIKTWYLSILELREEALTNVPIQIQKYIQ